MPPKGATGGGKDKEVVSDEDIPKKLKQLESKIKQTVREIQRNDSKVTESLAEQVDPFFLNTVKSKIKSLSEKLNELFDEFSELNEGEEDEDVYNMFTDAEDNVMLIVSRIDKAIAEFESAVPKSNIQSQVPETSALKLPKFHLPIFNGDFQSWISFREIFKTSIIENKNLTDIAKLQYLLSSCRGQAHKIISGFPLTEDNFLNAWDTLCKRYNNPKELAFAQLLKIFNSKQGKITNSRTLLEVLDNSNEALRNLKSLKFEQNSLVDLILIHHIQSKLDDNIRNRWEHSLNYNATLKFEDFVEFLEKEAASFTGAKEREFTKVNKSDGNSKFHQNKSLINSVVKTDKSACFACEELHPIYKCPKFIQMKIDQRWQFVKAQKLCVNCLRKNHFVQNCLITVGCKACKERHHSLLHRFKPQTSSDNLQENHSNASNPSVVTTTYADQIGESCTLLSTAIIKVKDANGCFVDCRALIDNGSQKSLITKGCCDKLKLKPKTTCHKLSGVNKTSIQTELTETKLTFTPYFNTEEYEVSALVVNSVTLNLPNFKFKNRRWSHLEGLILADPNYSISSPVEILLGADLYMDLLIGYPIHGEQGSPSAIETNLGWIVSGRVFGERVKSKSVINCHVALDTQLKKFWEVETIPTAEIPSDDDRMCEEFFEKSVERGPDGRYVVRLPFKSKPNFGNSSCQALKRFKSLEYKLDKNPDVKSQYHEFMDEYKTLNHMEVIPKGDLISDTNSFYLPHHFVMKEDSSTTKLRVVFDASARDSLGHSLNNFLHTGPKLQAELFKILLRFRTFPIAISGDVEKMFRMIRIHSEDTEFQRIFWRFSPNDPVRVYRLLTVTYGLASSPYLAIRTLHQLAKDEMINFPDAAKIILNDFYVDDLLSGANSVEDAKLLVSNLIQTFKRGCFNLRKWASNHPEILSDLPEESKSTFNRVNIEETKFLKVLGLFWNYVDDTLQINIADLSSSADIVTKRQLLSFIARIYDPLGFLAPATITLKILMQQLWLDKLGWDDKIPTKIYKVWEKFKSQLNSFKEIKLPRFISSNSEIENLQYHGFCDASIKAYSAVIYIRIVLKSGEIIVNLVTAKTRVAPLKTLTLPRLELSSALLLSKLFKTMSESVLMTNEVYFWSDSEIVLTWIKTESTLKDQFVKNRVNQISTLTSKNWWNHISGSLNPADSASRGIFPEELLHHELWWNGAQMLHEEDFPASTVNSIDSFEHNPSQTSVAVIHVKVLVPEFICKYSSWSKLIRITSYIIRFIHNVRYSSERRRGSLTTEEYAQATIFIVRAVQQSEFHREISALQQNGELAKTSKILSLNPFLDSNGILRVGGRLSKHATLTYDKKYPMLLPKGHHVTNLIVMHYHCTYLHAGAQLVLSLTRQKYWIPNGRAAVRQIIYNCLTCFKLRTKPSTQLMGDLPSERITISRPFLKIGIDFAGPIMTKSNLPRSRVKFKSYLCLFVCMATKAIHLELVSDLSTHSFLATLRRFISRRGLPSDIFTDNGSNFKGAASHLQALFKLCHDSLIQNFSISSLITWHFIPAYSPNFGGLWEASIKHTKTLLVRSCKSTLLNFEEMTTLLCQIEACLNSRPLTPLSSDPVDLQALTPGHFLIGAPLADLPETSTILDNVRLPSRWRMIQQMRLHFWTRWSREYLHQLQNRSKWKSPSANLQIGDLVLLHEQNTSPLQWCIGRISKVFPGDDQRVRVVSILTKKGEVKRSISKVSRLPISTLPSSAAPEDVQSSP